MIVTVTVEGSNGLGSVVLLVVVDERESLALACDLILGQVDAGNVTKGLEQFLQVTLLGVLGQVGNSDGGCVVGCK